MTLSPMSARTLLALLLLAACSHETAPPDAATPVEAPVTKRGVYAFEASSIDGEPIKLDRYAGKVLLIVNSASKCGFTPQYEALQALYAKHEADGLVILGFPSDQFGHQEPGTEQEIKTFCLTRYAVKFPLFAKIDVNGPNAHPLYAYMRAEQKGSFGKDTPGAEKLYAHLERTQPEVLGTDAVKWNFTKFLVDRSGRVVKRFEPVETPEAIEPEIVAALKAKP